MNSNCDTYYRITNQLLVKRKCHIYKLVAVFQEPLQSRNHHIPIPKLQHVFHPENSLYLTSVYLCIVPLSKPNGKCIEY